MNIGMHVSFLEFSFFFPDMYPSSTFYFFRNFYTFFDSGCTNLHSYQQCSRFPFLPFQLYLQIFDDSHSYWCEVIPHYDFDLRFSNN